MGNPVDSYRDTDDPQRNCCTCGLCDFDREELIGELICYHGAVPWDFDPVDHTGVCDEWRPDRAA
jgi:hypothetical protein